MIQERLNQGLSVFGYLLQQTPTFQEAGETRKELRQVEREQKKEAQKEKILGVPSVDKPEERKLVTEDPDNLLDDDIYKEHLRQAERAKELATEKTRLAPNRENARAAVKREQELDSLQRARAKAMNDLKKEQERKERTNLILSVLNK